MVSVGIGAGVWAATGHALAVPAATVTGVLVDADHALDYYYLYVKKDNRRLFVLLHGWEYTLVAMALVVAVWYHPILLALALGHLGHLVGDQLGNHPGHPLAYSIAYRGRLGFRRTGMFREPPATLSEALSSSIPLWRQIEPSVVKAASRLGMGAPNAPRRPRLQHSEGPPGPRPSGDATSSTARVDTPGQR